MINKLTKITLILLSTVLIAVSCKKDSDNKSVMGNDEEGINQTIASDKLNSVETEKPPRSQKTETEITDENDTYSLPNNIYEDVSGESQSKVELLINGSSSFEGAKIAEETSAFAWILSSKNGVEVTKSEKHLFIFSLNGKYLKYNNSNNTAEWGYYYLNSSVSKMGFDYKNGSFENKFIIEEISSSSLKILHNGNKLGFKPYQMNGVPSNAFTPKKNMGTPTTPNDTTTTEPNDTNAVTAPEFIKITKSEVVDDLDVFIIKGNRLGSSDSSALKSLKIEYIPFSLKGNDTVATEDTPILVPIDDMTIYNLASESDITTNPITFGGTESDSLTVNIDVDNVGKTETRKYRFTLLDINGNGTSQDYLRDRR